MQFKGQKLRIGFEIEVLTRGGKKKASIKAFQKRNRLSVRFEGGQKGTITKSAIIAVL